MLAAPLLAVSAAAFEPEAKSDEKATEAQAKEAEKDAEPDAIVIPEVKEEKRICRRISTDMASRRKERVCLTKEGWREFNQRR